MPPANPNLYLLAVTRVVRGFGSGSHKTCKVRPNLGLTVGRVFRKYNELCRGAAEPNAIPEPHLVSVEQAGTNFRFWGEHWFCIANVMNLEF